MLQGPPLNPVNDRPLLTVYRPHFLPNPSALLTCGAASARSAGIAPQWLVMFETGADLDDPATLGFDASAEFVPHHLPQLVGKKPSRFGAEKSHRMYDYEEVAAAYLDRPPVDWQRYPCVPTAWDNAPLVETAER